MRLYLKLSLVILSFALVLTACKRTADSTPNFEAAINSYYQTHPSCLWTAPQRFPIQVSHDDPKTTQFDALVDQGLLTRTTSEKKIIIISKQENNYDVSDGGRNSWTADPSQPGYGNFCYGHRKVSSVDGNSPTTDNVGAKTTINYHWTLTDVPNWASAAETQTAYSKLANDISTAPKPAVATLTNTASGWQVTSVGQTGDSEIVE